MFQDRYTITSIIREDTDYYTGSQWNADIRQACLYTTLSQALMALTGVLSRHKKAAVFCVIQNKSFDYYDGSKFVYDLAEAMLYLPSDAEAQLDRLSAQEA